MRYVCDAPGGRTWFRIESEAEAVAESEVMHHAVEKYFRKEHERAAQSFFIGQTRLVKIYLATNLFQIFPVPRRKIVNHTHARSPGGQRLSDVRPDEPRAARNKCDSRKRHKNGDR